jgi:hypothetical protein
MIIKVVSLKEWEAICLPAFSSKVSELRPKHSSFQYRDWYILSLVIYILLLQMYLKVSCGEVDVRSNEAIESTRENTFSISI